MYYFMPKAAERPVFSLPAVDHPLLVADLHLHLGRPAPPALHRAAGLGAVARHGVLGHADGAVLGRHGQRPAHAARRLGQASARIRCSSSWSSASPSTAWRRSKARCCRSRASTRSRTTPTGSSRHVHVGALGWNGFLTFAMLYWLVPRIYGTKLYSVRLANAHFWLATLGILFYVVPIYVGGITQGLMWREFTPTARCATRTSSRRCVRIVPMYCAARRRRHALHCIGAVVAVYNLYRTARQGAFDPRRGGRRRRRSRPRARRRARSAWHRALEATAAAVRGADARRGAHRRRRRVRADGAHRAPTSRRSRRCNPYTPLELEGRDLYIREGCVGCHSQMVRPIRAETERYGEYSKAGEFVYDHPFLWGSKRTGPDLHRVGGKYPDSWHYLHMEDPRATSPGSIMPGYPWLLRRRRSTRRTSKARSSRCAGSACRIPDGLRAAQRRARDLRGAGRAHRRPA